MLGKMFDLIGHFRHRRPKPRLLVGDSNYCSIMGFTDPAVIEEAYAAYEADAARIADLDYSGLSVPELLALQSRRERLKCAAEAVDHRILAALVAQTGPKDIGAKNWSDVLRIRLHISGK